MDPNADTALTVFNQGHKEQKSDSRDFSVVRPFIVFN